MFVCLPTICPKTIDYFIPFAGVIKKKTPRQSNIEHLLIATGKLALVFWHGYDLFKF